MTEPTEKDVLTEFEQQQIPEHYKGYYKNKRHNFFSTIQQFPYIWSCFTHLDKIVQREFEDMQRLTNPNMQFPMVLLMNGHAKVRIAIELACSTSFPEAQSIMRDAIESIAHAHRLASDPSLLKPWLEKQDGEAAREVFKNEFELYKAQRLFKELPELHDFWKRYSEWGSHTNLESIVSRFMHQTTDTDLVLRLNYLGGEPRTLVPALFELVIVFSLIEKTIFKLNKDRLHLDSELVTMREQFEVEKEATRQHVIREFKIPPPAQKILLTG
jgi:hypothetical protein